MIPMLLHVRYILQGQQGGLALETSCITGQGTVCPHHAVAWDDDGDRIASYCTSHRLGGRNAAFTVFGEFRYDFPIFLGIVGFSLALNGGVCKIVQAPKVVKPVTLPLRARLQPAAHVSE